jgi:hypothetical protein
LANAERMAKNSAGLDDSNGVDRPLAQSLTIGEPRPAAKPATADSNENRLFQRPP